MTTILMLDGAAANGQSGVHPHNGGVGTFVTDGAFDTSTITLQMRPNGSTTWIAVGADTTHTAAGIGNFDLRRCDLRVDLSSIGGSTIVSARLLF